MLKRLLVHFKLGILFLKTKLEVKIKFITNHCTLFWIKFKHIFV